MTLIKYLLNYLKALAPSPHVRQTNNRSQISLTTGQGVHFFSKFLLPGNWHWHQLESNGLAKRPSFTTTSNFSVFQSLGKGPIFPHKLIQLITLVSHLWDCGTAPTPQWKNQDNFMLFLTNLETPLSEVVFLAMKRRGQHLRSEPLEHLEQLLLSK
jgi:hypothetical protein